MRTGSTGKESKPGQTGHASEATMLMDRSTVRATSFGQMEALITVISLRTTKKVKVSTDGLMVESTQEPG